MDRRLSLANEVPHAVPDKRQARSTGVLWRSLGAVAIGAFLGTLAGARYDVLFGLSDPVCALLQSLLFTATWTYAGQARPSEMTTSELFSAKEEYGRSTVLETADGQLSLERQRVSQLWAEVLSRTGGVPRMPGSSGRRDTSGGRDIDPDL